MPISRLSRLSLLALLAFANVAAPAQVPATPPSGTDEIGAKEGPLARLDTGLRQVYVADVALQAGRAARVPDGLVSDGLVTVDVTAGDGDGAALVGRLEALGLRDAAAFGAVVSGRLPVSALGALAALDGLRAARAVRAVTGRRLAAAAPTPASPVFVGAVTGEAVLALRVLATRDALGVDGSGIRLGVLSDSYNVCATLPGDPCRTTAAEDIATGDLPPAGARVLDEPTDGDDEGRAMMQLARDVAPGLAFSFHTAFGGQASFAQGILDLADDGADVIVDDVLLLAEPFFQDGIVAQAVGQAVARGVAYFSSAGNQADDSYQATFTDSGLNAVFRFNGDFSTGDLHDFDPGAGVDAFQNVTLAAGESVTIDLQYAEPSFAASGGRTGATSDYDVYLVQSPMIGSTILAGSADNNVFTDENGSGEPIEIFSYTNETGKTQTVYLAVVRFSGAARLFKYIDFDGQAVFEYAQAGNSTSVAHNNSAGAFNVGASAWFNTPALNANVSEAVVNSFSSFGGGLLLFDGTGTRLPTPVDRRKPDAVGSDGDNNTFFGSDVKVDSDALPNFFGTSAAAPNVAAVAGLMLAAAGGPRSIAPATVYRILRETADDIVNAGGQNVQTGPGYDVRSGYGFVRGDRALLAAQAVPAEAGPQAAAFRFAAVGPNPAGRELAVDLEAGASGSVEVGLYDVLGRRVALLYDGPAAPALRLRFRVEALPAGTYVLRAASGGQAITRLVTVVR